ncbi:ZP3 protein, partial [Amia calva]|nr:ZP3 protein [Amia calva]
MVPTPPQNREVVTVGDSILRGVDHTVCSRDKETRMVSCLPGAQVADLPKLVDGLLAKAGGNPLVMVHIGTNDIGKGRAEVLQDTFKDAGLTGLKPDSIPWQWKSWFMWTLSSSVLSLAPHLGPFHLQLMTDDWSSQRPSNVYFLGDVMNIQASVNQANHVPLRLFVDSCMATLQPDQTSSPSYTFIGNHGGCLALDANGDPCVGLLRCLSDAKVTGSSSQFMPRPLDSTKLQMQLDAFRFNQDSRSSGESCLSIALQIYITCLLKVTTASQDVDSVNKACSFNTGANRWQSVDGSDPVCACCDSSCGSALQSRYSGRARDQTPNAGIMHPVSICWLN